MSIPFNGMISRAILAYAHGNKFVTWPASWFHDYDQYLIDEGIFVASRHIPTSVDPQCTCSEANRVEKRADGYYGVCDICWDEHRLTDEELLLYDLVKPRLESWLAVHFSDFSITDQARIRRELGVTEKDLWKFLRKLAASANAIRKDTDVLKCRSDADWEDTEHDNGPSTGHFRLIGTRLEMIQIGVELIDSGILPEAAAKALVTAYKGESEAYDKPSSLKTTLYRNFEKIKHHAMSEDAKERPPLAEILQKISELRHPSNIQ